MVRHTLKILQHLLQDFLSVSDHFTAMRSKGLSISKNWHLSLRDKLFHLELDYVIL